MRKSFILYTDYWQHIELLTLEERGSLLTAIFDYVSSDSLPDLTGSPAMAFSFIRAQLERDYDKWNDITEKRAIAGAIGGVKSGEARRKQKQANEANASIMKQKQANEAVTVTVNDTVNDTYL